MEQQHDVVIVGAGIGGSALAAQLASAGLSVLVLEQQVTYKDRVRGETIVPWGVREVQQLRIEEVLLATGGAYITEYPQYDELTPPEEAEATAFQASMVAPDVPGQLDVGHPEACEALSQHAERSGAVVMRGIADVHIEPGDRPAVSWSHGGVRQEARPRLVVGADGRQSTVRKQVGIALEERPARTYGAGLLVRAAAGFDGKGTLGTAGQNLFLAFPRQHDLARLYLLVDIARQPEFTGAGRTETFLSQFRTSCFPASEAYADGEAAGPCGGSPMTDSWTVGPPVAPGVVLIGDAAGWNDPIIGQGLSIALRDARMVSEILLSSSDWSPDAFKGFVEERADRMWRLATCAAINTEMRCTFTPEGAERRRRWRSALLTNPTLLMQVAGFLMGPEHVPADVFSDEAVAATYSL
ncbi:MAG TPA: FAD-dependent monooxygenase [Acidimicrobiales bacterium]|jgi:2-polyprenyl-6-methoxyphenol hydroxylase-like FAD-dependent oxidoreductase|nr:FAD-dependent monooxygenase [Acidimicrobiales bacterium]